MIYGSQSVIYRSNSIHYPGDKLLRHMNVYGNRNYVCDKFDNYLN